MLFCAVQRKHWLQLNSGVGFWDAIGRAGVGLPCGETVRDGYDAEDVHLDGEHGVGLSEDVAEENIIFLEAVLKCKVAPPSAYNVVVRSIPGTEPCLPCCIHQRHLLVAGWHVLAPKFPRDALLINSTLVKLTVT